MSVLADLVAWLPRGCALWRSTGGPLAITAEHEQLRWVAYSQRVLVWQGTKDGHEGRKPPEAPKPIPWASEVEARTEAAGKKTTSWLRRQELRGARRG